MSETNNSLPVITRASEFVDEFIAAAGEAGPGDVVAINTLQIAPQMNPDISPVSAVADAVIDAHDRGVDAHMTIDSSYLDRMTRIGNRDLPDFLPLLSAADRAERVRNRRLTTSLIARLASREILVESGVKPVERGYTPRLRHLGSAHLLQRLAVRHLKEAHVVSAGSALAWVKSANLTDSDLTDPSVGENIGMNNLSFRIEGDQARFVIRAMNEGFGLSSGINRYSSGRVTIVHDSNNSGEPARLPSIMEEGLITVDPSRSEIVLDPTVMKPKMPTHLVFLSQYLPDGLFYSALERASVYADVHIPKQPKDDHRVTSFPFNLHSLIQGRRIERSEISSFTREVPSHVKALVARYDDGSARIVGGTDNFATHLQKFVRNEELGLFIDLNLKDDIDAEYFSGFVSLLHDMGEISDSLRSDLLAN